ncbi:hypothetical protein [Chryseobacterium sp. HR92]|uniref:hypothetical protein n=1 Tax=Chryseobacterium sp. HR92 TaxID=3094839 RepID=UPI003890BCF3|nr:hypothetical protein SFA27_07080 [Chryseobacterium sp. HR92]
MKNQISLRFLLLILTLTTLNCSRTNDDDMQTSTVTSQYFHTPAWIQGTWSVADGTTSNKLYKFTSEDFILMTADGSEQSITKTIKETSMGGKVDETLNNSAQYNFLITFYNTNTTESFEFRKISTTQIKCKHNSKEIWFDLVKL